MSTFVENISRTMQEDRAWTDRRQRPPMLVSVRFERIDRVLSYYCDDAKLKVGDVVIVDGMLSYEIGVVTDIRLNYITPPYNMKWIREIVDAEIKGHYFEDGRYMVTLNGSLSAKQYAAMALGTASETRRALSGRLSFAVEIGSFDYDSHCSVVEIFKGRMAYEEEAVTYLSMDENGHGSAFLRQVAHSHGIRGEDP